MVSKKSDSKFAHKPKMTKEEVVARLRRMQAGGHSMKTPDIEPWFYRRIKEHFGSYKNAKSELGIHTVMKRGSGLKARDLTEVLSELRAALPKITDKSIYHGEYRHISDYGRRHYGDPFELYRMIGAEVPPDKKVDRSHLVYWTKERADSELAKVIEQEGVISSAELSRRGYDRIVYGVSRAYGTWNAGLVANGYEVAYKYCAPITAREAKEKTLKALANGTPPILERLGAEIEGLRGVVSRIFKTFNQFLVYCDVCPTNGRPKPARRYIADYSTPEGIRREITRLWYIGAPMNYKAIASRRQTLLRVANAHIGSWRKAVESAGIPYDSVCKTDNTLSECGEQFESVFAELLAELGYEFDREGELTAETFGDFAIKPDFILPNYRFIDCKLSEWTDASEMLKRYYDESPNGITIVYLRGKKTRRERGRKWRYEHASVYEFVGQLPEERRGHYCEILTEIERKANEGAVAS